MQETLSFTATNGGPLFGFGFVFTVVGIFLLPPILWGLLKALWFPHIWAHFGSKQKKVLLEIIPPRDIEKSPQPMEMIFSGFAGSEKSFLITEQLVDGEFPAAYSLEIVSTEGAIHFYIRTWESGRHIVEANFYAQYPGIELVEVPDYTTVVPKTAPNKDWNVWGCDFITTMPDLYPIKTYKHFEESVTGKMLDPLAGTIEIMSKAGPGQHMWLQYIVVPSAPTWHKTGRKDIDEFLGKTSTHKEGILDTMINLVVVTISNLFRAFSGEELAAYTKHEEKKEEQPVEFRLTPGEKEVLKALEQNISKQMFSVKMRYVYVGRAEGFNKALGVSGLIGTIKQFTDNNLNSFKPEGETKTKADYWKTKPRLRKKQREILHYYRTRDREPYHSLFHLSTEELATVFHIPDMSVVAPTMNRVTAKRSSAPMNLPIEL